MYPTCKMAQTPKKLKLKKEALEPPPPMTIGEEVDQAVEEWYRRLGLPIPPEEKGIGKLIDKQDRAANALEEQELEVAMKQQEESGAGPKPEFGTPEFWAWARKRKKEKDAERAAQGLPPLPTAKEKAEAKAKKAAEKEAKKSK
jgi:hypothetical protein